MAQEITAQGGLSLVNGLQTFSQPLITKKIDQTGINQYTNTQNIGFAAHELLAMPIWGPALGVAYFRNIGTTNFIDVGIDIAATFYPIFRLKPGEFAELRLVPNVIYYAQGDTAAEDLNYTILED